MFRAFCICLFFISMFALYSQRYYIYVTQRQDVKAKKVQTTTTRSSGKYIPLCVDDQNLNESQKFCYSLGPEFCTTNKSCCMLHYTVKRLVTCFDALYESSLVISNQTIFNQSMPLSTRNFFVFIGDSRIRQQYFNFLKYIPDYDRQINVKSSKHADINIDSNILELRVSFLWRPIISDEVMKTIRLWVTSEKIRRPDLILIGMEVHHMLGKYGKDIKLYKKKLLELGRILEHLANYTRIIWLNQYPIVDFYGRNNSENTEIHSEKVYLYNQAVRNIFKSFSKIKIWDSSNSLAEEYVRGCQLFNRDSSGSLYSFPSLVTGAPFINCKDFVHTGSVAITTATQILFNDICNAKL